MNLRRERGVRVKERTITTLFAAVFSEYTRQRKTTKFHMRARRTPKNFARNHRGLLLLFIYVCFRLPAPTVCFAERTKCLDPSCGFFGRLFPVANKLAKN